MRLEFRKITSSPKRFTLTKDNVTLSGEVCYKTSRLYELRGKLKGEMMLICDKSGEEFSYKVNDELVLYISDGIWNTQSQDIDTFDVVEFFDGFIDMDHILQGEIESIRLDYHTKS